MVLYVLVSNYNDETAYTLEAFNTLEDAHKKMEEEYQGECNFEEWFLKEHYICDDCASIELASGFVYSWEIHQIEIGE